MWAISISIRIHLYQKVLSIKNKLELGENKSFFQSEFIDVLKTTKLDVIIHLKMFKKFIDLPKAT